MVSSISKNASFLSFSKANTKGSIAKRCKAKIVWATFWTIVAVVVAVASLGVGVASLVVSCNSYNSRYDADATSSGGIKYTFEAKGKDSYSGSFTASVGSITYGYFQQSGSTPTEYTLSYKKSTSGSYSKLKNFTVYSNNNYTGAFNLATIKNSTKFDVKCVKNSNKTAKSVLEFDWGVE